MRDAERIERARRKALQYAAEDTPGHRNPVRAARLFDELLELLGHVPNGKSPRWPDGNA